MPEYRLWNWKNNRAIVLFRNPIQHLKKNEQKIVSIEVEQEHLCVNDSTG